MSTCIRILQSSLNNYIELADTVLHEHYQVNLTHGNYFHTLYVIVVGIYILYDSPFKSMASRKIQDLRKQSVFATLCVAVVACFFVDVISQCYKFTILSKHYVCQHNTSVTITKNKASFVHGQKWISCHKIKS